MSHSSGFLHTRGQNIVDENGKVIFLRGVGLNNWLLPEGYMWKFGTNGDRPRRIEKLFENIIGPEKAKTFWQSFRANYITEDDIKRIAELGFNSVRPALNARLFVTEEDSPEYLTEGFSCLDNLVAWCRKYGLYVIIDMHAAPGGQTGTNIDDSDNALGVVMPKLFTAEKYKHETIDLWRKIAERYSHEPTVIAYDLLNEPLPNAFSKYNEDLMPLYKRITTAIIEADKKHMITVEGANWTYDFSVFDSLFDDNMFLQFHKYWNRNSREWLDPYLKKRTQLNVPLWCGEIGENNNLWYLDAIKLLEDHNIGWAFWPWKKLDTTNSCYSIRLPDAWDRLTEYSSGGAKPSAAIGERMLAEFLENIRFENCVYTPDVVNTILKTLRLNNEYEASI